MNKEKCYYNSRKKKKKGLKLLHKLQPRVSINRQESITKKHCLMLSKMMSNAIFNAENLEVEQRKIQL